LAGLFLLQVRVLFFSSIFSDQKNNLPSSQAVRDRSPRQITVRMAMADFKARWLA